MWHGSKTSLMIVDPAGFPSDTVCGLHTNYPDEPLPADGLGGNTLYHHSFALVFQLQPTTELNPAPMHVVSPPPKINDQSTLDVRGELSEIGQGLGILLHRVTVLADSLGQSSQGCYAPLR